MPELRLGAQDVPGAVLFEWRDQDRHRRVQRITVAADLHLQHIESGEGLPQSGHAIVCQLLEGEGGGAIHDRGLCGETAIGRRVYHGARQTERIDRWGG